jgi:predicted Zn-dependent protease
LVVGPDAAQGVIVGQSFMHPGLDFFVRFPDEWKVQNGRDAVGAVAPDQSALVLLDVVGDGDDPLAGARALERASGSPVVQYTKPMTVGDLTAAATRARTRTDSGEALLALTWIAYGGHIYQVLGMAPMRRADVFQPVYETVVQSFRPLQPAQRAGIRENHLRVVEARTDETVAALSARSKSRWKPGMVAVVNDVSTDAPLVAGQLLKVSISEPYASVTH